MTQQENDQRFKALLALEEQRKLFGRQTEGVESSSAIRLGDAFGGRFFNPQEINRNQVQNLGIDTQGTIFVRS